MNPPVVVRVDLPNSRASVAKMILDVRTEVETPSWKVYAPKEGAPEQTRVCHPDRPLRRGSGCCGGQYLSRMGELMCAARTVLRLSQRRILADA